MIASRIQFDKRNGENWSSRINIGERSRTSWPSGRRAHGYLHACCKACKSSPAHCGEHQCHIAASRWPRASLGPWYLPRGASDCGRGVVPQRSTVPHQFKKRVGPILKFPRATSETAIHCRTARRRPQCERAPHTIWRRIVAETTFEADVTVTSTFAMLIRVASLVTGYGAGCRRCCSRRRARCVRLVERRQ